MKRPQLKVEKREITGKKTKKLRREGILPANIYGKDVTSTSVQLPFKDFETIFKEVGKTGLLDAVIEGEKARPVLIHSIQTHPVTGMPIHADLYQVNLKEKITTMVPVVTVGEAKAVTEKVGLLLTPITEVEVEALPADLPENIEINVENLAAVDEQLTVADLKAPEGVTILTEPEQVVVKVAELVSEEAKADAEAAAAAAEEAAAEGAEDAEANAEAVKEDAEAATEEAAEEKPKEE